MLVVLVIFFFLRSLRATLIPLVTIPVSLIGAFALMYVLGFSHQHADPARDGAGDRPGGGRRDRDAREHLPPHRGGHAAVPGGASRAAREIGFAVVAMTLTLAAVYAPLALLDRAHRRLFTEFALTLAGAVLVSGFVALTLSPMMCSKLLRHTSARPGLQRDRALHRRADQRLSRALRWPARAARSVAAGRLRSAGCVASSSRLERPAVRALKSELAPTEDRGIIVGIVIAPEGATIEYTDGYARRSRGSSSRCRRSTRYFVGRRASRSSSQGDLLRPAHGLGRARRASQQEIVAASSRRRCSACPACSPSRSIRPRSGRARAPSRCEFVIADLAAPTSELQRMVDELMAEAREQPAA